MKRNEFSDVDKKSVKTETEEPETVVEEVTQESLKEMNSTTIKVENEEETNEIDRITVNGTLTLKKEAAITFLTPK